MNGQTSTLVYIQHLGFLCLFFPQIFKEIKKEHILEKKLLFCKDWNKLHFHFCITALTIDQNTCQDVVRTLNVGQTSTFVTYSVSATGGSGQYNYIYIPPSGSNFGIGTTQVTVIAQDQVNTGSSTSCTFNVIVNAPVGKWCMH